MSESAKKKRNIAGGIWLLVILLLFLVLLSGVLVYSILGSFSDGEHNVIALVPGHNGTGDIPTMAPVGGEEGAWESKTSVNLFLDSYTNVNGEVSVESSNGDKIIAPGTSNAYAFSLKNTGNISMDFTMTLNGLFTLLDLNLPIEVRLRSGGKWLAGDENTWLSPKELNDVEVTNTIARGGYINYVLEWQWPFEGGEQEDQLLADLNDTIMGGTAVGNDINFTLSIQTHATATEGSLPTNENGILMITELIPPLLWYIILGVLMLLILGGIVWYFIAKKKKDENEPQPEFASTNESIRG